MKKLKTIFAFTNAFVGICFLIVFFTNRVFSQYPQYFLYDSESGLPSNEVYSIIQDKEGFIWIGSDAGLCKFDGIRFFPYKCSSQNSKPISNLVISSFGTIFCTNFHNQIFYLEKDTLKEIKHPFYHISNIAIDKNNVLYISHSNGVSYFNCKNKTWSSIKESSGFTRSIIIDDKKILFLTTKGVGEINANKFSHFEVSKNSKDISSYFLLAKYHDAVWIFRRDKPEIYTITEKEKKITKIKNLKLYRALWNKKITNIKSIGNDKLWITTYSGVICYDIDKDSLKILYPNFSFSDVFKDREGNYWFASLQAGLLFVPDLNNLLWSITSQNISSQKITHLVTNNNFIYFSTLNGEIGKLNLKTTSIDIIQEKQNADIECLYYNSYKKALVFNSNNHSYISQNEKINVLSLQTKAIKSITYLPPYYIVGTSMGLFIEKGTSRKQLSHSWIKQILTDRSKKLIYAATNKGIEVFENKDKDWIYKHTMCHTAIISIDLDTNQNQLFAVSHDAKLYVNGNLLYDQITKDAHPTKLRYFKNNLYISTNKGIYVYNLINGKLDSITKLTGLVSNHVDDLLIQDSSLWIATSKGIQKMHLYHKLNKPLARVFLKTNQNNFEIKYNQVLTLHPQASIYSSIGKFTYAYRINKAEWVVLPSNIEQIEIQNLPYGKIEIELKAIDHLNRDSENTIVLQGTVIPPFWKSWWFNIIVTLMMLSISVIIFKVRWQTLKHKQQQEIDKLKLENKLRIAQQTAIKAQMNPHFIFNVLSSIKSYIYENDRKKALLYLSRFSDLIRKILEQSAYQKIQLQEEIDTLNLYIELESMLFNENFEYQLSIDKNIDTHLTYIPSMLIQPLIENAFKHGLRHKKDNKRLNLNFKLQENMLIIEITDNGIGRVAAEKINQQFYHQSFASKALEQRLEIINFIQQNIVHVQIIDMYDDEQHPTGTKVILSINLNP
ncbi:MAG: histidine kinase [Bacteroidia bacterium]|nr:histidine kinase [Bacteroidia bacterium]